MSRRQTQRDRDETQHRLPDPSGPVFGLGRLAGLLALLRGKPSFDRSGKDFDNSDWRRTREQLDGGLQESCVLAAPAASFSCEVAFDSFSSKSH